MMGAMSHAQESKEVYSLNQKRHSFSAGISPVATASSVRRFILEKSSLIMFSIPLMYQLHSAAVGQTPRRGGGDGQVCCR